MKSGIIGILLVAAIIFILAMWILGAFVRLAWLLATSKIGLGILVVLLVIHIMTKDRPD
jgi:hypothetical protein